MDKSQFIRLYKAQNYLEIIYRCYEEEVKVEPKLGRSELITVINTLCAIGGHDVNDFINYILDHYTRKFSVMRVYSKDSKFITII